MLWDYHKKKILLQEEKFNTWYSSSNAAVRGTLSLSKSYNCRLDAVIDSDNIVTDYTFQGDMQIATSGCDMFYKRLQGKPEISFW